MTSSTKLDQNDKAVRLLNYLLRLSYLRSKLVRDIDDYERVLWINDIPRQKGCFTQAWGRDEEYDNDIWAEVQHQREPPLPIIPDPCKDWIDKNTIRNTNDLPELLPHITRQIRNFDWVEESDQPEFITNTEKLSEHSEVQKVWAHYIEDLWIPWAEEHNTWEIIQKVYSAFFAIHQEQLRLGEEYELLLGLGLLTWQTPNGQQARRHLIVANASLEFEARLGKFTVRPNTDGAVIRPELDMLDIEEQPARIEEMTKESLKSVGDDPWDKECIENVLKAMIHSIDPQGEYSTVLGTNNVRATSKPIVEYAPAFILRKRSAKGLSVTIKNIIDKIQLGETIPEEFADLAEITEDNDRNGVTDPGESSADIDNDILFPKPSNEEQRRIAYKLRTATGVLVQGPPGTGKSHTIANLICHLLATGQRTLITAKTPRALKVLENLVPEELRPLCINLLGSGLEEKRSLESSISGILRKNDNWNELQAAVDLKEIEDKLRRLREEQVKLNTTLRIIRESETHSHSIAQSSYSGTVAHIVQAVNRDRGTFEWFTDSVFEDIPCPITENDLRNVLYGLRWLVSIDQEEISLSFPDFLLMPSVFNELVLAENTAAEEESRLSLGADIQISDHLSKTDEKAIQLIIDSLSAFQERCRQIASSSHDWVHTAMRDILLDKSSFWTTLLRVTRSKIDSIKSLVSIADDTDVCIPDNINHRSLNEDIIKLREHLDNNGKLGWWFFRPKKVNKYIRLLKLVRINGRSCINQEKIRILEHVIRVRIDFENISNHWNGICENTKGPYALQLQTIVNRCAYLINALSLEMLLDQCRYSFDKCPFLVEPIWINESKVEILINSCTLALVRLKRYRATEKIKNIEDSVAAIISKGNAHSLSLILLKAIQNRDIDSYNHAFMKIEILKKNRLLVKKLIENANNLGLYAPRLIENMKKRFIDKSWEKHISLIEKAWNWAYAKKYIEDYLIKEDVPNLLTRSSQVEVEINTAISKLASLRAWSYCFSRLDEDERRNMIAWQQSMRRLGKGTGKHAPRHRKEAREHLNKCRVAVPAWVMPLHRIWDTVDPAPGMFEVIIIDEASQCGLEALPLFYIGKKILIVGDDKQISPDAVGLPRDAVHKLMEEYLYDFNFQSSFDIESSLFDHGKLRYGTRRITLREHFRCMPEIIRFSNDLCYSDTPLIPLRQYGPDRLEPLQHVYVKDGYREGANNLVTNRPEANAIAEKIESLCQDHKYVGKTMGVVVLQGDSQGKLIETLLLNLIGAEEMDKRRIVCGNPYSFQGDQRDIMFLSMVAATNERIGPFTKAADERRFNVAASRARDQMWLFHSVNREDLSTQCLRRRLLDYFEKKISPEIGGILLEDLERIAAQDNRSIFKPPNPFDSWFEVDVALEILRRGFYVIPQYEIAGKWIDLVIEGGNARLAIECDGDEWHGVDQYEADMQRQRMLERKGIDWVFFRVRASAFYSNKEKALQSLWHLLEARNITPGWGDTSYISDEEEDDIEASCEPEKDDDNETEDESPLHFDFSENRDIGSSHRPDEVSSSEIFNAILHSLEKCPNNTCTLRSLTSRVLREVGVLTRGAPRFKFENRVMRILNELEQKEIVEKYKAKNKRIRLLKMPTL